MSGWLALGLVVILAWAWLLLFRGFFWVVRRPKPLPLIWSPPVLVVVPARDEEATVGPAVRSLMAQDYPGELRVILVDDGSRDGTAEIARDAAEGMARDLEVVEARPTSPGWSGKLWAMAEGVAQGPSVLPDARFVLFTDADIVHDRGSVSRLVARAEAHRLDLASSMVRLSCRTWPERALIPAFVFFFRMLYPFRWVSNPRRSIAAAAGGCMLVRKTALERIGGLHAIRGALIDDCALARAVKPGGPIWLGLSTQVHSIRVHASAAEVWRMIARTAYTQLGHSPWLLAATVVGMLLLFLAPPYLALTAPPAARLAGLLAWLMMSVAYVPTLRFHGRSPLWAPCLPLIAAFYLGATLDSALRHWQGRGGSWKGRTYRIGRGAL
jgi:hopene-associated glycosyltransferase HpnB